METTITKLKGDLKDLTDQMEGLDTTTQPENMNNTLLSESVTKNKEDIQKLVSDYNKMSVIPRIQQEVTLGGGAKRSVLQEGNFENYWCSL